MNLSATTIYVELKQILYIDLSEMKKNNSIFESFHCGAKPTPKGLI